MNPPDEKAQERVKGVLKAELARRHISYRDLAERLGAMGIKDNERNIANKLSRGTFTAAYFVLCLDAIGCRVLRLKEDD
jgi:3-mercaptopyruvate sulfurtransferase SseA